MLQPSIFFVVVGTRQLLAGSVVQTHERGCFSSGQPLRGVDESRSRRQYRPTTSQTSLTSRTAAGDTWFFLYIKRSRGVEESKASSTDGESDHKSDESDCRGRRHLAIFI